MKDLSAISPKTKEIKARANKCNIIKLISFCIAKEAINKVERLEENICK